MQEDSRESLGKLLTGLNSSAEAGIEAATLLDKYFEDLPEIPASAEPSLAKQIEIMLDQGGDITVVTSRNLPNLKFHLGEFLLEVGTKMARAAVSLDKPAQL